MRRIVEAVIAALLLSACTSIDCPVENVVATSYKLLKADGTQDTLRGDTLTISTTRRDGNDTVLLNRSTNTTAFTIPISSGAAIDTLLIEMKDSTSTTYTYIYVEKTDQPHFESVDCAMSHFHTISNVTWEGGDIDSVTINKAFVDYDSSTPHLYIYIHPNR